MRKCQHDILAILQKAIHAVHPDQLLPAYLSVTGDTVSIAGKQIRKDEFDRLYVMAVGKAAAAMADNAIAILGNLITEAICITKQGHALQLANVETIESGHPLPDENSVLAGERVVQLITGLNKRDILLLLISGGSSALLADLPAGISLHDLQTCSKVLVNSGATIEEINIVRKHTSHLKGGQLAASAQPATVFALIISDVVSDDLSSIGSGPTVPDNSNFNDAKNIMLKYDGWHSMPASIKFHIEKGLANEITETPKPGNPLFNNVFNTMIGNNEKAIDQAADEAKRLGYHVVKKVTGITGDTEVIARQFVQDIMHFEGELPACFMMGGETTLQVTGEGKGGRNQHFVLCALDEFLKANGSLSKQFTLLCAGTDGTDGPTDVAGAIISTDQQTHITNTSEIQKHLGNFDSYHYFEKTGSLIQTGPTQTNVMDIMIAVMANE